MTKTTKRRTPADPRHCHACGARVTSRGPRAASGRYYCSTKADCQAAKQRDWRSENLLQSGRGDAPSSCSCCGRPLTPRKVRVGDSKLGRWCHATACRNHRNLVEGRAAVDAIDLLKMRFYGMIESGRIQECPECGLEDAVAAFAHPKIVDGKMTRCEGLGIEGVPMDTARARWPQFF